MGVTDPSSMKSTTVPTPTGQKPAVQKQGTPFQFSAPLSDTSSKSIAMLVQNLNSSNDVPGTSLADDALVDAQIPTGTEETLEQKNLGKLAFFRKISPFMNYGADLQVCNQEAATEEPQIKEDELMDMDGPAAEDGEGAGSIPFGKARDFLLLQHVPTEKEQEAAALLKQMQEYEALLKQEPDEPEDKYEKDETGRYRYPSHKSQE